MVLFPGCRCCGGGGGGGGGGSCWKCYAKPCDQFNPEIESITLTVENPSVGYAGRMYPGMPEDPLTSSLGAEVLSWLSGLAINIFPDAVQTDIFTGRGGWHMCSCQLVNSGSPIYDTNTNGYLAGVYDPSDRFCCATAGCSSTNAWGKVYCSGGRSQLSLTNVNCGLLRLNSSIACSNQLGLPDDVYLSFECRPKSWAADNYGPLDITGGYGAADVPSSDELALFGFSCSDLPSGSKPFGRVVVVNHNDDSVSPSIYTAAATLVATVKYKNAIPPENLPQCHEKPDNAPAGWIPKNDCHATEQDCFDSGCGGGGGDFCSTNAANVGNLFSGPVDAYKQSFRIVDPFGFDTNATGWESNEITSGRNRLGWWRCVPYPPTINASASTYFENFPYTGQQTLNNGWFIRHGTGCYLTPDLEPVTTSDVIFNFCLDGTDPATGLPGVAVRFYCRATGTTTYRPDRIEKDGVVIPATLSGVRLTLDTGAVYQPVEWMKPGTFRFYYQGIASPVEITVYPSIASDANPLP